MLKVLEWNIRGAASFGWDNEYKIQSWMVDEIIKTDSYDIIVLNEFVITTGWDYFQHQLKQNGYIWFMTYTSCANGILIALKNKTFNIKCRKDIQVKGIKNVCSIFPDFLAVTLNYYELPLTIVGTRINVALNYQNPYDDFKQRKYQFNLLCDYLSKLLGRIIVVGDFNNGNIFDESNKNAGYLNCPRQNYNYQMIWREIEDNMKLTLSTPDRGGKYGSKFSIVTKDKKTKKEYYTKEDHMISKGFNISICDYLWDFVKSENGYNVKAQDYKGDIKFVPDHAIFYAEMQLDKLY